MVLIRSSSPARLGLTHIAPDNARSLLRIRKAGNIYQLRSDQPSARATIHHRPLQMTSQCTQTRSKYYSGRCITLTSTQLALIALMISFSSHLLTRLWTYAILKLSMTTSLCPSSSLFNLVYVTARGCMTAQLLAMRILSTIGMRTTPSNSKSVARSQLVSVPIRDVTPLTCSCSCPHLHSPNCQKHLPEQVTRT